MKNFTRILITITCLVTFKLNAQTIDYNPYSIRTIDVTGTAEKEVIPDEIFISITLQERFENKDKITIDKQEKDLKAAVTSLGLNLNDLTLADANADYIKIKRKDKDVIAKAAYILKVKDAATVGKVFEKLDEIKIFDSYIARVDHSKMEDLKKEVRTNAVKAAKEKANYLLAALGEQTGRVLKVTENSYPMYEANMNVRNMAGEQEMYKGDMRLEEGPALEFKKINIQASVYIVFEIK